MIHPNVRYISIVVHLYNLHIIIYNIVSLTTIARVFCENFQLEIPIQIGRKTVRAIRVYYTHLVTLAQRAAIELSHVQYYTQYSFDYTFLFRIYFLPYICEMTMQILVFLHKSYLPLVMFENIYSKKNPSSFLLLGKAKKFHCKIGVLGAKLLS